MNKIKKVSEKFLRRLTKTAELYDDVHEFVSLLLNQGYTAEEVIFLVEEDLEKRHMFLTKNINDRPTVIDEFGRTTIPVETPTLRSGE